MIRPHFSFRLALAVSLLVMLVLAAGASTAGYLLETHSQHTDLGRRLATAAAYVERGKGQAGSKRWQTAFSARLAALGLRAQLVLFSPTSKHPIYTSSELVPAGKGAPAKAPASSASTQAQPTANYTFPFAGGSDQGLALALFAAPLGRTRGLLVSLISGLAVLLAGSTLLFWATGRWLVTPLRRLSAQVDAIAGGDRIETRATSPIREVGNVATAVAGMSARLSQTAEQDARSEAERRLLVSSIAHDLRTPLFSLRGYLDAIAAGIGDPQQRLDSAREKARQIDRLVSSLFDYALADIDQRPRLQTTDLAGAVSDATAAFELAAGERGVELRLTVVASPSVTIDRDGFERALANVIDNALRHTPHGATIEVTCGEDTDVAFVQVVDDGPGIPPDLLPRVFEPLVRADGARSSHTGGAGLGLTIAARLLRNQGGSIDAANAPGGGAILTLRLPRPSA